MLAEGKPFAFAPMSASSPGNGARPQSAAPLRPIFRQPDSSKQQSIKAPAESSSDGELKLVDSARDELPERPSRFPLFRPAEGRLQQPASQQAAEQAQAQQALSSGSAASALSVERPRPLFRPSTAHPAKVRSVTSRFAPLEGAQSVEFDAERARTDS